MGEGLRQVGAVSSFEEARRQLDAWEREGLPADEPIVLVYGGDPIVLTVTGEPMRPSCVAGLCFAASQLVLWDGLA